MAKLNDITGKTFGNWIVLYRNGSTPNKAAVWRCKCLLCGSEKDVVGSSLTNGYSTKCRSCVPKQTLAKPHRKERIYTIYTAMKQRCTNPHSKYYCRYGGRGISVCGEWLNNPDTFFEWAFANGYKDGLTIDRVDCNGNYEPSNCRWIPLSEQSENRRCTNFISFNGDTMSLSKACRLANISRDLVRSYAKRNNVCFQEAFNHCIM